MWWPRFGTNVSGLKFTHSSGFRFLAYDLVTSQQGSLDKACGLYWLTALSQYS